MTDGMLSLSWNNHSTTFCHTLASLRTKERYTDVTLACEGKFYPVHKLVLSTCSEYFENMFENTPCKHPVIVLRDVQCDELEALLSYMYAGVVSVAQTDLSRLIKVAELLEIKGLAVPDEPPNSSKTASHNQQVCDDGSSPHVRNRHSYCSSSERSSPYQKTKQSHISSDDRISPHPKKRRKMESEDPHSTSNSSSKGTPRSLECEQQQEDLNAWSEGQDTRQRSEAESEERVDYHSATQEVLPTKVQVSVDESLVKEEVVEDLRDIHNDSSETGHYDSMTGDSSGGGQDSVGLVAPKYDHLPPDQEMLVPPGHGQPPPLHEAVIEALAGPSGMQAWPGGGDMGRRLTLGEGFGDSNQDIASLPMGQPTTQAHQLVRLKGSGHRTLRIGPTGTRQSVTSTSIKKLYQCPYCSYQSNKNIKRHIRSHIGEKPHPCPYCSFRAAQRSQLKNHLRTHTGEKPYSCHLCSQRFALSGTLRSHIMTHTGEKPYACHLCPQTFARCGTLKSHILTHTGEKPYVCEYCPYQSSQKTDMKKHTSTHNN